MKTQVDAGEFGAALEKAGKVIARSCVPVLEQARVDFSHGGCSISATNLEQWVVARLPAEGDTFSLVFRDTRAVLKACKYFSGPLRAEFDAQAQKVTLTSGGKTCRMDTLDAADFPEQPEPQPGTVYHTNAATLAKRYERIKYAVPKFDKSRPARSGTRFLGNRMIAVDGYRLALNTDDALNVETPFILPDQAMKLLPLFGETDVAIEIGPVWVSIAASALQIHTQMLKDDGFSVDRAIPTSFADEYTSEVRALTSGLKYLTAFITDGWRQPVTFSGGGLSVSTPSGDYWTSVPISGDAHIVYGVNGHYLLDGLRQFKHADTVRIQVKSPISPIVLTDGTGDLALVLPSRLKNAA